VRATSRTIRNIQLIAVAAFVLTLVAPSGLGQEHGGSLSNTHNDLWIIVDDAENPFDLGGGRGSIVIRETIAMASIDPNRTRDYAIIFIAPEFTIDPGYPRLLSYEWEYTVANYTLMLVNETDAFEQNITGIIGDSHELAAGDLGPDDPEAPHPRANATYNWSVKVVDYGGHEIMTFFGGNVTTTANETTPFDLAPLGLPPLGENLDQADTGRLIDLTFDSLLEPHEILKDGFYKFSIGDMQFYEGVTFTLEFRYSAILQGAERISFEKLLFTSRPVHIEVFTPSDLDVKVFSSAGSTKAPMSPTETSSGPGLPTKYSTSGTFSIEVRPEGEGETDAASIGRYVLLFGVIAILLVAILWTGPGRRSKKDDERSELIAIKEEILEDIKDLDEQHDNGEISDKEWDRRRKELKEEAVEVMRSIDGQDAKGMAAPDTEDRVQTGQDDGLDVEDRAEQAELLETKAEVLAEIKDLDKRHDRGDLTDDEWEQERAELKAEAVETMRMLAELEGK
jgi:uncharacterized membrane protein